MMRLWMTVAFGLVAMQAMAADETKPFSCKYNDDDGKPTQLFERVESGPDDWYSRYKAIQFCERAEGKGSYVLIEEELIHGFQVLNPARPILSSAIDAQGVTAYQIADDIDHVILKLGSDGKTMEALGDWAGEKYEAKLKRVWPQ